MLKYLFPLLVLIQIGFGQPQKPASAPVASPPPQVVQVTDPILLAKVDSLTFALKEIRVGSAFDVVNSKYLNYD